MKQSIVPLSDASAWQFVFASYGLALSILLVVVGLSWYRYRCARAQLERMSEHDT